MPCYVMCITGWTCGRTSRRLISLLAWTVSEINRPHKNPQVLYILYQSPTNVGTVSWWISFPSTTWWWFQMYFVYDRQTGFQHSHYSNMNDLTTKELALLFFTHWYCENGLPKDIISDCDKLFLSKFWHTLHRLTGVKLKLSSAYHPETDGTSKWSNKTINQCIRYHVCCNQKGWVQVLPWIHFDIMNSG